MTAPPTTLQPSRDADAVAREGSASRPPSLWPTSLRPDDHPSTGFGATGFGPLGTPPSRDSAPASVFDVCHAGVVLRALFFVHAVVFVGVAFNATGLASLAALSAYALGAALPGVLLWLLVACGLKRTLGSLPLAGRWLAALTLGALAGSAGAAFARAFVPDLLAAPNALQWLAPALAGAGLSGVMFKWLLMRGETLLPAHTSARLAELQSRIRPHFLFNTLNTALTLVRLDPARAEVVLEDLAELFRVAISDGAEASTLADEIDLARRYLAIEQIRFGQRLRVSWELDPAAGAARLPPLLLQPLVENAVRHGVEPADDGGAVRIRTRVRLGRALISIVNTLPAEPSLPGNGMALRNVRERLRLMHDVAAQFDTRRDPDVFRVEIVVPL